jgi:hypothetical protein
LDIRILTNSDFFYSKGNVLAKIYKRKFAHGERWYADFTIRSKQYRVKFEAQNKEQARQMAAKVEYEVLANSKFKSC